MAVLHRTKDPAVTEDTGDPAVTEDRTAVQDRTAVDDAPTTERTTAADQTVVEQPRTTRRRGWRRRRDAAAPGVGVMAASAGAGMVAMIARTIRLVVGVAVLLIALGIAFTALKASPSNTIVSHVHDWASWLTTPFHNMFHVHGARGTLALNWGVAIIVYLALTWLITGVLLAPARAVRRRRAAAV